MDIPVYTKEDFLDGTAPFQWLYENSQNLGRTAKRQLELKLDETAKKVGFKNFLTTYKKDFLSDMAAVTFDDQKENITEFEGQELTLNCGSWQTGEFGVVTHDRFGFEILACAHPILPIQRLINVDTGMEKLKIAFNRGRGWRSIIVEKNVLATAKNITKLADYGIAVNSENGKYIVNYLTDLENLNYEYIPEVNSTSRLGWIEGYGFSPYVDNLAFDGNLKFKTLFESVKPKGFYKNWIDLVKNIRKSKTSVIARILLAASFASVLVEPLKELPFFVHVWGNASGIGKTVGLYLAASVWATPQRGKYTISFNSTDVGQEVYAGFVNSMPLIIDELQILGDKKDFDEMIYKLAEGVGRIRGNKSGGVQDTLTWHNCILTSGEQPILSSYSAGGAVGRTIEIEANTSPIFDDFRNVLDTLYENYGHAGKMFVERLVNNMDYVTSIKTEVFERLSKSDFHIKQIGAASILLTADKLVEEWIFNDSILLQDSDITQFLSDNRETNVNVRALQALTEVIAIQRSKFDSTARADNYTGEIWGDIDKDYTYIIKSQFDKILDGEGFNAKAFLCWAKQQDYIVCEYNRNTKKRRIGKSSINCVCLKNYILQEEIHNEELPF